MPAVLQRIRRAHAQVPSPLRCLLVVTALFGIAWAVVVPAFQVTDEDAHFGFIHTVGEKWELPGDPNVETYPSEMTIAVRQFNSRAANYILESRPAWSEGAYRRWLSEEDGAPRDNGGGAMASSGYPPAYYFSVLPAYLLAKRGDLFERLIAVRIMTVGWLLVTTVAAWLLAGVMFGRRRELQLVCAATAGLWPMVTHLSAGSHPDSMQIAMWTLFFWLGALILRHGLTTRRAVGIGAVTALGILTKATSIALVPGLLVLLAIAGWQLRRSAGLRTAVVAVVVALVVLAIPTGAYKAYTVAADRPALAQTSALSVEGTKPWQLREFGSYVWQFYLPKLSFQKEFRFVFPTISTFPLKNTWFGNFVGTFGWTNVWFPRWFYDFALVVFAILAAGFAAAAVRWKVAGGRLRRALPLLTFFAATAGALLLGLHLTDYRWYISGQGPFLQGRYLLPLIGLWAVAVTWAVSAIPRRFLLAGIGIWLGALVAYQIAALLTNVARFYA